MLIVDDLTKIYHSKKRQGVKALDHVSFVLPDRGLVFLTGKSGSGKSTLLNLIGGIDEITFGDIVADGNKLSLFSQDDYDCYRNSYLGFIFQDFCLLEDLTVNENILLSLDLQGKTNKGLVEYTLERVGLGGYGDRYPRELSGGQKQRVAIARSLVKNPRLILADEPTGNLDSRSAEQVLLLLKELSKQSLIVIVSHNLDDAYKYGDRIIELADGRIILDVERVDKTEDKGEVVDGRLFLPYSRKLKDSELKDIKEKILSGQVTDVVQRDNSFENTKQPKVDVRTVNMERSKLTWKKCLGLSGNFLKRRRLNFLVTALIVSCLIVLLGLCQFFYGFNLQTSMIDAMADVGEEDVFIQKGRHQGENTRYVYTDTLIDFTDEDIENFVKDGYSGDYYKVYNFAFTLTSTGTVYSSMLEETRNYDTTNLRNFYALQTYGTTVTTEDFLVRTFGKDGKLDYIGNLNDKDYGLIITDYIADSLIYYNPTIYTCREDIVGSQIYSSTTAYRGYINAIIDTDYEEKYATLQERLMHEYKTLITQNKESQVIKTEAFLSFAQETRHYLGMAFTTNEYWFLDNTTYESRNFVRLDYTTLVSDRLEKEFYFSSYTAYPDVVANEYFDISLESGECAMKVSEYNRIFGTAYSNSTLNTFESHEITLNRYPKYRNAFTDPRVSAGLTITKLLPTTSSFNLVLDTEDFSKLRQADTFCYAILFDDIGTSYACYDMIMYEPFYVDSPTYEAVATIYQMVSIFKDFFLFITIGLCFVAILLLMSYSAGNIRKRKFEIGVIKAMGGRTTELSRIFVFQVLLMGLATCLASSVFLYLVTPIINETIAVAMIHFLSEVSVITIPMISFSPLVMLIDIGVILTITILSAVIPLRKLHKIKPINIMRHRD